MRTGVQPEGMQEERTIPENRGAARGDAIGKNYT